MKTIEEVESPKPIEAVEETASVEPVEQPEPEPPKAEESKDAPKPTSKKPSEALSIDRLTAYEEVMKSVARQKTANTTQDSLPFDFAQEPVTDFSPPNPAKEGFISADHLGNLSYCLLMLGTAKSRFAMPEAQLTRFQELNQNTIRGWKPAKINVVDK